MTIKLIGLLAVTGVIAVATLGPIGPANADRQSLSNPAVKLAVSPSADPFTVQAFEPALGSAFLSDITEGAASLEIQSPPTRLTAAYNDYERALSEEVQDFDIEVALSGRTPSGIEVELAPRAGVSVGPDGQTGAGAGAEFRIGQGLRSFVKPFENRAGDLPTWYLFAATDGSALTWRPGEAESGLSGLRFQEERVVVGDAQIGVSMEVNGVQASLSLVNREITNGKDSTDQNFVGATLTWRR